MSNFKIFNSSDLEDIMDFEDTVGDYLGVVYFLEYGDKVKIGRTRRPYHRIKDLRRTAIDYNGSKMGRVAFTPLHTNFVENEKKFHKYFDDKRVANTELFNISFENLLRDSEKIGVVYKDESKEMEEHAKWAVNYLVNYFTGNDSNNTRRSFVNVQPMSVNVQPNSSNVRRRGFEAIFQ